MISHNLYQFLAGKNVVARPQVSRRAQNSLTSDLPGLHLDGRSINGERPFLVGSAIICRLTDAADRRSRQSMQLTREPNVDPMFFAKPRTAIFRTS